MGSKWNSYSISWYEYIDQTLDRYQKGDSQETKHHHQTKKRKEKGEREGVVLMKIGGKKKAESMKSNFVGEKLCETCLIWFWIFVCVTEYGRNRRAHQQS